VDDSFDEATFRGSIAAFRTAEYDEAAEMKPMRKSRSTEAIPNDPEGRVLNERSN